MQQEHGEEGWKEPGSGNSEYRLEMKFEERNNRPIYFYSNDLDELYGLMYFGIYCKKKQDFEANVGALLSTRLNEILSVLFYKHTSIVLNSCIQLTSEINTKSEKIGEFIGCFSQGLHLLELNRGFVLETWAKANVLRSKRSKPRASLRLKALLRTMLRITRPTEDLIVMYAKKIGSSYKKHCEEREDALDMEIKECAKKKKQGFTANIVYHVHNEIRKYALGQAEIPARHLGCAKFNFPTDNLSEDSCLLSFDSQSAMILLESQGSEAKNCMLGDISSLVLNQAPEHDTTGKFWLRINGRKINKELGIGKLKIKII